MIPQYVLDTMGDVVEITGGVALCLIIVGLTCLILKWCWEGLR